MVVVTGATGAITFFAVFAGFAPIAGKRLGSFEFEIVAGFPAGVLFVGVSGLVFGTTALFRAFAAFLSSFFVFETVAVFAGMPVAGVVVLTAVFAVVFAAVEFKGAFAGLFAAGFGVEANDLSVFGDAV